VTKTKASESLRHLLEWLLVTEALSSCHQALQTPQEKSETF